MKKKTAWLLVLCMIASLFSIMTPYGTINAQAEETAESSTFVHPGILHTQKSIEAVKANIAAGDATTVAAYNALRGDGFSDPNWGGRPLENVVRGNTGDNRAQMYIDIERAYHTGLLYQLDAGDQYGDAAVRILNGWSHTMKSLSGNADRFLAAGIYGYQMANAAELVRDHKDFDKEAMDTLLLNIFYPMNKDFLENHNGAAISNYWANWDLCNIASMMAIGIFCDREDIYHEALSYYKNGEGMGSVFNTMPYVYATGDYGEELAQWQESGRDQGHATLGIGLCGAINEMAWSQGDDLYGMSDNRFLKAAEYVARYNNIADTENCDNLPFSSYTRKNSANGHYETGTGISGAGRPSGRPIYTAIYNHYVNRMGLEAPALKKILYPEDGSLVIEGGSRNGDQPGWQSLMFNNISTTEEGKNVKETVGPLEDGIYRFCNNLSKKTLVDNDGKLQCAKKGSTGTEWWNVKNTGDGEYVISNVKTGRVIQIDSDTYDSNSPAYVAGTVFTLGDSVTGEMNQRLAILKNKNDYVYRIANAIGSHVMELAGANTADDATICQWRYEGGAHQQWLAEEKETKGVIAYFNFDDKTEGFKGAGAAATVNGTVDIVEDQERGKVASFDHNAWLNVTKEDGTSLLSGNEELTISYYSKIDNTSANRGFYAAADTGTQVDGSEQYIGCLQQNKTITAERYSKATAGRKPSASGIGSDGWNHIVVVYAKDAVKLYVNGTLTATADNTESLTEILGTDSILQIGKANLKTDEYYQGLMDEFTIYNYALDESTIQNMDAHRLVAEFTFDDEIDGFATTAAKAVNAGTVELYDDTVSGSGKSLRLDGTGSNYLSVKTFDGKPLASGFTEMTVSYWSKVKNTKNNWMFYVAPDDEQQILNAEVYLGAAENNGSLKVERYKNSNKRIASIAEPAEQNVWKHVTVSFGKDITKVYINGEKQAELKSSYSVADILGENSVFYLGKANWGKQSEFSDALIDTVHIYNFALNDAQVAKDYAGYDAAIDSEDDTTDHSAEKTAAQKVIDLIQAIGTVEYTDACYKRITDARTAYDALTEAEKLWVTNADALFHAEKLYKELIPTTPKCLASFTFDDEESGFVSWNGKAVAAGTNDLSDDAVKGKALSLDGTGTNYLTVTKENGDSLLTGLEELTISYWNKVDNDASNWVYYMAPDDAGQNYLTETYLGMLEKQGKLTAERYKNSGQRPGSATATVTGGAWNHVTVVYSADKTSIYVNGALSSEMGSGYKLSDILGENGIFYLGKANWGTGEYYNGLIDEVSIYDYALDAKDVEKIYQAPEAVKNVTELVNAIGIVDASAECKAKIDAARAAYDGLFEIQKEMLTEDVSTTLTTAEAAYKKAVEEAGESGGGTTEPGGNESGGGTTEPGGNESGGGNTQTGGNENSGGNTGTGGGSTDTGSESTDAGSGMTNTGNSTTTTGTSDTEQAQKEQAQAKTTAVEETHKTITSANTDKGDVAGSKFAALKVKAKEGNKSVKLSWSRVNGADGYIIYGAPCGKKMERIKELTASKKTYTVRKLLKGRYYKYMVVAYKNIYGEKRVIETSVSVHVATKGGKNGNPTAVTYGKSKVSVKTGKTFTLKAGLKTKTKVKTHIAKFRYESTDPSIATVNKKGKIKGIRKGTCEIYIYAQNGLYKKVKVTVK